MRNGLRETPTNFGAEQAHSVIELLADAHEIESSKVMLRDGKKEFRVRGLPGVIPTHGREMVSVGIIDNAWALSEAAHKFGERQDFCLRG